MQQRKNVTVSLVLSAVCIIALAACQQKTEQSVEAEGAQKTEQSVEAEGAQKTAASGNTSSNTDDVAMNNSSKRTDIIKTTYQCDDGEIIQAIYNNSNINSPKATLIIDGRQFELYHVIAASGALYATEQGINAGQGMRWHTKGLEATLQTMTLDDSADPAKETLLMRCQEPI